jgi:hypothetical protein
MADQYVRIFSRQTLIMLRGRLISVFCHLSSDI